MLHLSSHVCSQSSSDQCCWLAKGLVKRTQLVSRFRRFIVSQARWAGTSPCWKIKNSPQISRMTRSSFWVRSTSRCTIDLHSSIDKNQVHWSKHGHTHGHYHRLAEGSVCLQQTFWLACLCLVLVAASRHEFSYHSFWLWPHGSLCGQGIVLVSLNCVVVLRLCFLNCYLSNSAILQSRVYLMTISLILLTVFVPRDDESLLWCLDLLG